MNLNRYTWYVLKDSRKISERRASQISGQLTEVMEVEAGVVLRTTEFLSSLDTRAVSVSTLLIPFESLKNIFKEDSSPKIRQ